MKIITDDIFNSEYLKDKDTMILHCISADYALGKGFAAQIEQRYKVRDFLKAVGKHECPDVIAVDNILNMVTKQYYYNKPTPESFNQALILAREFCLEHNVKRLIMPRIGSGLDRLDWEFCRESIKYILDEFDIDCIVYEQYSFIK